jgi:hypothetical protein
LDTGGFPPPVLFQVSNKAKIHGHKEAHQLVGFLFSSSFNSAMTKTG